MPVVQALIHGIIDTSVTATIHHCAAKKMMCGFASDGAAAYWYLWRSDSSNRYSVEAILNANISCSTREREKKIKIGLVVSIWFLGAPS